MIKEARRKVAEALRAARQENPAIARLLFRRMKVAKEHMIAAIAGAESGGSPSAGQWVNPTAETSATRLKVETPSMAAKEEHDG